LSRLQSAKSAFILTEYFVRIESSMNRNERRQHQHHHPGNI